MIIVTGPVPPDDEAPDEDDGIKPLADRLVTELTAHRTLALRDALANDPGTAFAAVLHALCLSAFYRYASNTCLEITAKSAGFTAQAPGLADTASAKAIDQRHQNWAQQLPEDPANLWDALLAFDNDSREALFAHCAALTVNVVQDTGSRRSDAIAHGDRLAQAVGLDMAAAGWTPTVANYLGRVTKARILEAVREAKGDAAAQLIDHLKKPDMAKRGRAAAVGYGLAARAAPHAERGERSARRRTRRRSREPTGLPGRRRRRRHPRPAIAPPRDHSTSRGGFGCPAFSSPQPQEIHHDRQQPPSPKTRPSSATNTCANLPAASIGTVTALSATSSTPMAQNMSPTTAAPIGFSTRSLSPNAARRRSPPRSFKSGSSMSIRIAPQRLRAKTVTAGRSSRSRSRSRIFPSSASSSGLRTTPSICQASDDQHRPLMPSTNPASPPGFSHS